MGIEMMNGKLTKKGKIGKVFTRNRIVMNAFKTALMQEDGGPSDDMIAFYTERAEGGAGTIIVDILDTYNICSYTRLTCAIHQLDSKIFAQLNFTHDSAEVKTVNEIIHKYIDITLKAKLAGFDGVELVGVQNELIENVVAGIRNELGRDYPIIVYIPVDSYTDVGLPKIIDSLKGLEIDAIDLNINSYDCINIVKGKIDIPIIASISGSNPMLLGQLLKDIDVDFIGFSQGFVADEALGSKICEGRDAVIKKCISCNRCSESVESGKRIVCSVNPRAGCELKYNELRQNGNNRVVVIVGAGVAGLAAAVTLKMRGFRPIVFEKKKEIGGQAIIGKYEPVKEKLYWVIDYYNQVLKDYDIEFRLNCEASPEIISELKPSAVFIATGAVPVIPLSVKGIDLDNVYFSGDILYKRVTFDHNEIVIIGAGLNGVEMAERLKNRGNSVSVVDIKNPKGAYERLTKLQIEYYPYHQLKEITHESVVLYDLKTEAVCVKKTDSVVLALGLRPLRELAENLSDMSNIIQIIGDAKKIGNIGESIRAGYIAAYELL